MYRLNAEYYASVFVVPSVIVEKYIKMASFCALKSLLWILKNQGSNYSAEDLAKAIGSSVADTKEALDYWVNEGVLLCDGSDSPSVSAPSPVKSDSYLDKQQAKEQEKEVNQNAKPAVPEIKIVRPTMEQIVDRMAEDKTIEGLFNQAQIMLGRTIGFDMQSAILMMLDTYGLPVEIILDLLQYCIDIGKTSNAFILSVAKSWYEKDITTPEKAQQYVHEHNEADRIFEEFRQFTGINAPKATPKQAELFIQWSKMGFSVEMMVLAYNEGVERTGKISYSYINKILLNWNEQGYKTPADIEKGKEDFKKKKNDEKPSERSYDIEKAIKEAESGKIVYQKKKRGGKNEI